MKWRSYPEYKDSGVEWLGELPAHWKILSIKRISRIRYGLSQPPIELIDGIPLIRATNVKSGRISENDMLYVDPADVPQNRDAILSAGDIIVVRSGAYTGDSAIIPEKYVGAIAGYDIVLTPTNGLSSFFSWQLLSPHIRNLQFGFYDLRAAQPHLNAEQLGATLFLAPPIQEQRAIAAFLDRKTMKIDKLIAKKKRLIELLQEKRAALISQAVTKGLDPCVPMKDSGVEWLGKIPVNWDIKRLKYLMICLI
jgi:type I restriction enzyme S subunit